MTVKPSVFIVDAGVSRTGGFIGAQNIADALSGAALIKIVLPYKSAVPDHDLRRFQAVHRLAIANLRKTFPGVALYLPRLIASSWALARLLRRENCKHLVLNDFYLMHGVMCRVFGYRGRIVSWVRIDPSIFGGVLPAIWLRLTRFAADDIVAVSNYIQRKLGAADSVLIYDPIRAIGEHHATNDPQSQPRMIYVGNYIPGKGQDDALEAFASVAAEYPQVRLEFWGGDMGLERNKAFRSRLVQRATELGMDNCVAFNGFADDPVGMMQGAQAALNFSRNESFSMTVLEACAAGLPVIATRCGGPEEIIVDGETGILVPVADIPAMASAMRLVLSDPGRAAEMGLKARDHVKSKFSFREYQQKIRELLRL